MYLSDLYIKQIDGFPLTSSLVTGGDIVPNLDNAFYLGNQEFAYKNVYVNNIMPNGGNNDLNIYGNVILDGEIDANAFNTSSDARIKSNISDLDSSESLYLINNLSPRLYTLHTAKGDISNVPGFISQEVDLTLPSAVSNGDKYIGNIKKIYPCELQFTTYKNEIPLYGYAVDISDLSNITYPVELCISVGNRVQYMTIQKPLFTFMNSNLIDNIYIYGTLIHDFKLLSYDYIYTLNVAATKELYKLINMQANLIKILEERISALENS